MEILRNNLMSQDFLSAMRFDYNHYTEEFTGSRLPNRINRMSCMQKIEFDAHQPENSKINESRRINQIIIIFDYLPVKFYFPQ